MLQRDHRVKVLVLASLTLALRLQADESLLPKPTHLVSDRAGVLDAADVTRLESRLQRLRDAGVAHVIVYVAPALPEGSVMEEVTIAAMNRWGVGDKGIAIFAFMKDRKVRIEIGRGLQRRISDDQAAAVIKEQIVPSFRQGKYAEGLTAAIDQIEALLRKPH